MGRWRQVALSWSCSKQCWAQRRFLRKEHTVLQVGRGRAAWLIQPIKQSKYITIYIHIYTLTETNIASENMPFSSEVNLPTIEFQDMFRCYSSFRKGMYMISIRSCVCMYTYMSYIHMMYVYVYIYIYVCLCVCVNFHLVTIEQLQQSERKLGGLNDGSPTIVRLLTLLT